MTDTLPAKRIGKCFLCHQEVLSGSGWILIADNGQSKLACNPDKCSAKVHPEGRGSK